MTRSPSSIPASLYLHAEDCFRSRLVQQLLKREPERAVGDSGATCVRRHVRSTACETANGPAGQNFRELLNILLRVPAVHAQRVQLEQLARVVFIQPTLLSAAGAAAESASTRARTDGLEVVEVDQHRRMPCRREHHVFEPAEHVRPDGFSLVAAGKRHNEHLRADRHTEMIRPERDEPFDERPIGRRTRCERGTPFGAGDLDQAPPRLLAGLPLFRIVHLTDRAERPNRVGDRN